MKKIFTVATFLPTVLFAQDLVFGVPQYYGPGCPIDSIVPAISPDGNAESLLFDQFNHTANFDTGSSRITCQINIPFSTLRPTLVQADYRGFDDIPGGAYTSLRVSYALDLDAPVSHFDSVYGPDTTEYTLSHQLNITCNGTRILKLFVDSFLSSSSSTRATYMLSSIDLAKTQTPDSPLQLCNSAAGFSTWAALAVSLVALLGL